MSSSFGTNMLKIRSEDDTMNVGKKWTTEEDNKLLEEITDNKTYKEIALEHKRTVNGIELRVISYIIYPKIKIDLEKGIEVDMEQIALEYKIDSSRITRYINKLKMKEKQALENKETPKQTPKENPKRKDAEPTNKEILDYLRKLDSKIDEIKSNLDNLEYLR
jgi:hypothetical protein